MRVLTYLATDESTPPAKRAVARIMLTDGTMHPVIFEGATAEALKQTAEDWWAKALAKEAAKGTPRTAKAKPAPTASSDDFDVV